MPPSNDLGRALAYALGTFQQAGNGYARGMAAAVLMVVPRGLDNPPATVTMVRDFNGTVMAVTLADNDTDNGADAAALVTHGGHGDTATIGNPARANIIDGWHALHDADQWGDRDIMIQSSPAGGTVIAVCDPTAPNPDWERQQFLIGVLDGLRLLGLASR